MSSHLKLPVGFIRRVFDTEAPFVNRVMELQQIVLANQVLQETKKFPFTSQCYGVGKTRLGLEMGKAFSSSTLVDRVDLSLCTTFEHVCQTLLVDKSTMMERLSNKVLHFDGVEHIELSSLHRLLDSCLLASSSSAFYFSATGLKVDHSLRSRIHPVMLSPLVDPLLVFDMLNGATLYRQRAFPRLFAATTTGAEAKNLSRWIQWTGGSPQQLLVVAHLVETCSLAPDVSMKSVLDVLLCPDNCSTVRDLVFPSVDDMVPNHVMMDWIRACWTNQPFASYENVPHAELLFCAPVFFASNCVVVPHLLALFCFQFNVDRMLRALNTNHLNDHSRTLFQAMQLRFRFFHGQDGQVVPVVLGGQWVGDISRDLVWVETREALKHPGTVLSLSPHRVLWRRKDFELVEFVWSSSSSLEKVEEKEEESPVVRVKVGGAQQEGNNTISVLLSDMDAFCRGDDKFVG